MSHSVNNKLAKTYNHSTYTQNHNKKFYFFCLQYIRMTGKNIMTKKSEKAPFIITKQ